MKEIIKGLMIEGNAFFITKDFCLYKCKCHEGFHPYMPDDYKYYINDEGKLWCSKKSKHKIKPFGYSCEEVDRTKYLKYLI